jgi:NAD(P)H-flavin reductase/ferredoxin
VIQYNGSSYDVQAGETVLTCLERHGVNVPSFCRNGVCQTCLLKVTEGTPPAKAQTGLKPSWKRQGFILSCVCDASEPLTLVPSEAAKTYATRVLFAEQASPTVVRLFIEKPPGFEFEGGQFVQLQRPADGVFRPYSIASIPSDEHLEFHIAVYPDGLFSPWLTSAAGQEVRLCGPFGECSYVAGEPERPLLLAATGTGLAPIWGVLRAALVAKHQGPIVLYHGARVETELYHGDPLEALHRDNPQVSVVRVCLEAAASKDSDPQIVIGDLSQVVLARHPKPEPARVYLCGSPVFVQTLKKRLYLAGASLSRIHSDPFLPKGNAG